MTERDIIHHPLQWRGITISISFEEAFLGFARPSPGATAHLQVQVVSPEHAPLPITETGYLSHFVHPDDVEAAGGPVAYVEAWIEHDAKSPSWVEHEREKQQLSLF